MAPPQGETRVGKVPLAFARTGKSIGKWLQWRFIQVQAITHGKGPNSASDSSSGRRNTPPSIATHLPVDNQLPSSMSVEERKLDSPLQPSQPNLYVNLPPPPPPPQHAISPLIRAVTPVEQINGLTEGKRSQEFYDIEKQHDKLMEVREHLMGCRSQMEMDRKKIHEIRERAGAQEGSVINQLRNFLHEKDITLPRDIEETFEQIDALRDQLGLLEAEYDYSEENYTMKELEHSKKEMHFIERLGSVGVFKKQSKETEDSSSPEKGLQLVVQTKKHQETEKFDESQGTNLTVFANKENVDDWLVDTLFQSPIPLEESDQDSQLEQVPEGWYLLGTIGAQFHDEKLEDSYGRSNEHDSALSCNGVIPYGKPVLVLQTKKLRSS